MAMVVILLSGLLLLLLTVLRQWRGLSRERESHRRSMEALRSELQRLSQLSDTNAAKLKIQEQWQVREHLASSRLATDFRDLLVDMTRLLSENKLI